MPVVIVVRMPVIVVQHSMDVLVLMMLDEVNDHTCRNEDAASHEPAGCGFAQEQDAECRPDERCGRKVGSGARRPHMAQRERT